MTARLLVAAFAAILLSFGMASATSLGEWDDLVLDAAVVSNTPCTATSTTLLDGLGNPVDLTTGVLPIAVAFVDVTGLSGDCAGAIPVVTVVGLDLTDLGAGGQVLSTDSFAPLVGGDDVQIDTTGSALRTVASLLTSPSEVRIAFVPAT